MVQLVVASRADCHQVLRIIRQPVSLDLVCCRREAYQVVHLVAGGDFSLHGADLTQWIRHPFPLPQMRPQRGVVDLVAFLPVRVRHPSRLFLGSVDICHCLLGLN